MPSQSKLKPHNFSNSSIRLKANARIRCQLWRVLPEIAGVVIPNAWWYVINPCQWSSEISRRKFGFVEYGLKSAETNCDCAPYFRTHAIHDFNELRFQLITEQNWIFFANPNWFELH